MPGGLGLALAIPADLAQFYGNILALSQKLMYIYGWPDIRDKKVKSTTRPSRCSRYS